jgi:hypothetical protein
MEKAYEKLFAATDEVCCKIVKEKRILTSTVNSDGTYYLLLSEGKYFLVYLDEEACKCVDLKREIISISSIDDHLIAFVRTERGFAISRANETNGLITKNLHSYEMTNGAKILAVKNF